MSPSGPRSRAARSGSSSACRRSTRLRDRPSYQAIDSLPLDEKVARLRDPAVRAAILAESPQPDDVMAFIGLGLDRIFPIGEPPDYEPRPDESIAARAEREGRDPTDLLYDLLLAHDGRELLLRPLLGYSRFTHDPIREMVQNPATALGLGDGGAHCGAICDASIETYMLTHWVRDRSRGERLPLELVVRKMTSDTASLYGLGDRGEITPGKKADLNVIDLERLELRRPEMHYDLPGDARRLLQRAEGYDATIVSGKVVLRDGEDTGARPGALLRGALLGRPGPVLGADAPEAEPRQLGDPGRQLVGVVRRIRVGEGVAARGLGDADERVREHTAVLGRGVDLDELADGVGGGVQDLIDDAGELGIVASRGAEQEAKRGPVVDDEPEVGAEALLHALATGRGAARRRRQLVEQLAADVREQLDEEGPLRREVLVQHRLRNAGRGCDVVHRGRVEAGRREHVAGDIEKLPPALLGRESHGHRLQVTGR